MLRNSGPYGPSESPMNASQPVNLPQLSTSMNVAHNLSNMDKIAQSQAQMSNEHFNLPDYTHYGHHQGNLGSQTGTFPHYSSSSYQDRFMDQNAQSVTAANWQNDIGSMASNSESEDAADFLPKGEKRSSGFPINSEQNEPNYRTLSITVPRQSKPQEIDFSIQREDNLFNANSDKFNNFYQNNDFSSKTQDRPLLNNTKRKCLENTVRLIEDILTNTTRNKELQLSRELRQTTPEKSEEEETVIKKNKIKIPKKVKKNNVASKKKSSKKDKLQKTKLKNRKGTTTEKEDSDIATENAPLKSLINEKADDSKNSDKMEHVTVKVETQDPLEVVCTPHIEIEVVKVESDWTDTEYVSPFRKDSNGKCSENVTSDSIINSERSVTEALEAIKKVPAPTRKTYYECPHCSLLFNHPKRFLIHTKWHNFGLTNEKRIEMAKEREFKKTQRKEAKISDKSMEKKNEDVTCTKCNKVFASKNSLKNHRQKYHPTRVRECKLCGMEVIGWFQLKKHAKTHHGVQETVQCPKCDKVFKNPASFNKHRQTHLEKTISCTQCDKKYSTPAQIKIHMKVHERAERGATFHCSYCGKAFYEAYSLNVHERTHRNERPFLCNICNATFGTNSSLKRHLKVSHSSSKPYACSTCRRSFTTEGIRDRHAARAHGVPELFSFAFRCTMCDCKYLRNRDLQKHIYKVHRNETDDKDVDIESDTC